MPHILLVDDDEEDYLITDECLFQVFPGDVTLDWAKTFESGLEYILTKKYDICLIDHQLGPRSGLDLIARVAEQRPEVLMIMLTGTNNPELDRKALNAGAMDFVNKEEMTPRFLERVMRHAFQRKSKELQLRWARKKAERAQAAMKQLLAHITHELRSPLIGMMGLAEQLQEVRPTGAVLEIAQGLEKTAHNSLDLVNDLLDFSKFDAGKITLEERDFSLQELVTEVMRLLQPRALGKAIDVSLKWNASDVLVCGDAGRLRQILLNLMSNAIKFTAEGQVTLSISSSNRADDVIVVCFEVADSGIGIAPDKLDQIFEPFTQADKSIYRLYGGTGLGLAITRGLVELMNGSIEVKSELGKGSLFRFNVPLNLSQGVRKDESAYPAFSHLKVLVADDNPVSLKMAQRMLQKFAVIADTAVNGLEAIEKTKQNRYDLLLLDINMPELDGLETTTMLRQRLQKMPYIVAQTAHVSDQIHQQCLAVGMNAVLTKPLSKMNLSDVLQQAEAWVR